MCGIAGIVHGGDRETLQRMIDLLSHRGPDDQGLVWFDRRGSGLAHRRLSILDLSSAGHQPMANRSGERWITYNGEIYNYRELRDRLKGLGHRFVSNTDTEVILAAYDEWGPECVRQFNGMFAFAIYDETADTLFIARDHLGVKPLYYLRQGETFAFASESKSLFEIPGVRRSIDFDGVVSTLLYLWIPEPRTAFEGVRKLEPGEYGLLRDGELHITRYWDVPTEPDPAYETRREEEVIEECREILERAVRRQMIADVPVGAFLSGGLDSSLIVALMRKVSSSDITTYTIAFSERDKKMEAMPDDARYAALVSRAFGTRHIEIEARAESNDMLPEILWHLDDPIADGAAINTFLIADGARRDGTTVLLNGMGGDEVFGGYRKQLATLLVERYRKLPEALRRRLISPIVGALPVSIGGRGIRLTRWAKKFLRSADRPSLEAFMFGFCYFTPEELRRLLASPYDAVPFDDLYPVRRYRQLAATTEGMELIDRMLYLDTKLFLPGLNLNYSDKAAMAASIETRPPLIDVELVEFVARLPARYKINGRVQKYLLKRAAEAYLPREIIYRPKAAFGTPIRSWMKSGIAERASEVFSDKEHPAARFLRMEFPLRLLDEHRRGAEDHAHRLWGLYTVATWLGEQSSPKVRRAIGSGSAVSGAIGGG